VICPGGGTKEVLVPVVLATAPELTGGAGDTVRKVDAPTILTVPTIGMDAFCPIVKFELPSIIS